MPGKLEKIDEDIHLMKDGTIVEGLATGGKVLIVRDEPDFRRHILPYFSNTIMVVICLVILMTTGKFWLPFFVIFLISPAQNYFGEGDNKNLSTKS